MNGNLYKPLKSELIKVIDESPLIKTFVLVPEAAFSFATGQFIEVTVDGMGEAPFTPSSSPLETGQLEITVIKTGYVTDHMHSMQPGENTLCYGSKTPEDCIYKPYIQELRDTPKFEVLRSVDQADGDWSERVGVVTVLLDDVNRDLKNSVVVVCGPPVMMKLKINPISGIKHGQQLLLSHLQKQHEHWKFTYILSKIARQREGTYYP